MSKKTQSFYIAVSLLIVTVMGFLFKYYTGFAHKWFNDYGAAVFYEIFWCLFAFLFFRSPKAMIQIPLWVFIITCILEFLQLWHPPLLEQLRCYFNRQIIAWYNLCLVGFSSLCDRLYSRLVVAAAITKKKLCK